MHATAFPFLAEIAIPDARQCFAWAAPVLVVLATLWLIRNMEHFLDYLFPHWKWEKQLGWLNFSAHRRAEKVFRWLGYFVYAVLGLALFGIVWVARGLGAITDWTDSSVIPELALRVPILVACLGFWLVYLAWELLPKLRGQYEEEELQKFRAEQEELERDRDMNPTSRLKSPLHKTRINSPTAPNRNRRL